MHTCFRSCETKPDGSNTLGTEHKILNKLVLFLAMQTNKLTAVLSLTGLSSRKPISKDSS